MKLKISDSQGPFTCFNTFKLFPSIQICIHQLIKQKSNAYFGLQKIIKVWNEYCFCQILDHRRQRTKYSEGAIRICITSTQMTDVTWAPIFTTHAVDNPFPKTAARPSWLNQCRKRTSFKDRYIPGLNDTVNTTLQLMWKSRKDKCKEKSWWHYRRLWVIQWHRAETETKNHVEGSASNDNFFLSIKAKLWKFIMHKTFIMNIY